MLRRVFRIGIVATALMSVLAAPAAADGKAQAGSWPPYAVMLDETSAGIRWKTAAPSRDSLTLSGGEPGEKPGVFAEEAPLRMHSLRIEGLKPGAVYRYGISGTSNAGMEGSLRVPRQGPESAFFVISDTQALSIPGTLKMELSRQRMLVDAIERDPRPADFLVHTGDLVESGNMVEYDDFFHLIAPLTSRMPVFAVKGNHDDRSEVFEDAFAFRFSEKSYGTNWHHFHTENALFVFLNLNFNSIKQATDTKQWLGITLEKFQDRKWKIVFTHQPIYSNVEQDMNTPFRSLLEPLFTRYGVDVVISGHHHAYQRIARNGIMYIVSGGGGPVGYSKLGKSYMEGTLRTAERTIHYLYGTVEENRFVLEVCGVGRERKKDNVERLDGQIDRFELTKP